MALITIYAVIYIPRLFRVSETARVIAPMANGALEGRIVRGSAQGIRVAIGADAARGIIAMIQGEPSVIKRRRHPICRVVACPACGWDDSGESGVDGKVIRYRPAQCCSAQPFEGVATIALGRRRGEVTARVAARARNADMRSRQGKIGLAVVERGWLPGRGRVANLAGLREMGSHVIRTCRRIEIFQVAGNAGGRQAREDIIDVAGRARHVDMETGQREESLRMIEDRARPGRSRMA